MNESHFERRLDQQLCFRLYRASNGISKLYAHALLPVELTFPQYLVLLALWDHDGVAISDIGQRTGMGIGTLNPILKRLTDNGWVKRQTHESDKRTMLIFLTAKALEQKTVINQLILKELATVNFEKMDLLELMKQLGLLQTQLDAMNL
ncbi:MarR family winged helix-turn-helix transcriptional regulator [Fundicoccus ignavus]|uniref:MarR family transcriptional regulator n=1 Tax=Fundicoccus ignavus TaxID=2664442 RepID=A0A6I2GSD0_9LACT|nr:MarR family transcriptional regulator [Fundicoccus ignavus]MRI86375.1 MarR family transcriptional regulator [Fundicoccus ignavus]MRJ46152.1 MarR family transcriptional regulator [Fundicoccus ignavus]